MEIKGKCIAVLPKATGQGKNGTWESQDFVIETTDQYPKKVCCNLYGDKISMIPQIDNEVTVNFDVESKEYNGRWFTNIRAWKVERQVITTTAQPANNYGSQSEVATPPPDGSDLPF